MQPPTGPAEETVSTPHLLRVCADDPDYQRQAAAEAAFWAQPHPFGLETLEHALAEGPVEQWTNARFTGSVAVPWEATIASHGRFRRGLVIGTRAINAEARILQTNPDLHLTFVDISAGALARRRELLGARFPGRVDVDVQDANFLTLPSNAFDLIVSSASVHHVTNLEHLAAELNRALRPEGSFFLQDYVGERRFQFDPAKRRIVERMIFEATPPEWRFPMHWLDTSDLSPFCGVRSDDVLPVMAHYLHEEDVRTAGALSVALLRYVRSGSALPPDPPAHMHSLAVRAWRALDDGCRRLRGLAPRRRRMLPPRLLDDLLRVGDLLVDARIIAPGNAFARYRKRA